MYRNSKFTWLLECEEYEQKIKLSQDCYFVQSVMTFSILILDDSQM